ncbi:flagellar motor protein MotB [Thalassococcus lentus]|uniref:OmpA family protein n=1 Tax=Thalassococcus lentus TaxID=1210524 RepID=A0ABT4XN16_9RHOB|nr:flagellar motor protein MotB [Thalassococcus lentus]MDA7423342.1 OmpA family protein [Thalassococcus lentus]
MSGDSNVAPIIIKRKKVVAGDGHHGGAWKVAYADFVTAMMAFFLLMWLLNATTEKQRKGIADYFSPTIAMTRVSGGGDGALGGDSVFAENTLPRVGTGATMLRASPDSAARGSFSEGEEQDRAAEDEQFKQVEDVLMGRGGESMVADETLKHIVTRVTDEGLIIELFETEDVQLFEDKTKPTALLRDIAQVVTNAAGFVTNQIAIEGHTAAFPLVLAEDPAWTVSSQRAVVFRELMKAQGLEGKRVQRVTAYADREPSRRNPMDYRNNRLEIIFLRE